MIHHEHTNDHFSPLVENIIIFGIFLVIILMLVEDIAAIFHWPHQTIVYLTVAAFIFDLLFSIEFVIRSIVSKKRNSFKYYITHQRGWIDFLSSFPLLFFFSGPAVIAYLFGSGEGGLALGFFMILKTAKAIRVARILRLIRLIKLFGKIQNTESVMTNRQIGNISTTSVVSLIVVLAFCQFLSFVRMGDHNDYLRNRLPELNAMLKFNSQSENNDKLIEYIKDNPSNSDIIQLVDSSGNVIYQNPNSEDLKWSAYDHGKPMALEFGYKVVLSFHIADSEHAKLNLIMFFSILGVILFLMFGYSPIFAQQVADPAFVMHKGFTNWDYNFEVKINENFPNDEIFRLAKAYNRNWLPLKNKILKAKQAKEEQKSVIKMDDIF
jgi:hypothetical protein